MNGTVVPLAPSLFPAGRGEGGLWPGEGTDLSSKRVLGFHRMGE
jgi:hypothetical protein